MDIKDLKPPKGRRFPAVDFSKQHAATAAAISKLEKDRNNNQEFDKGQRKLSSLNTSEFQSILADRAKKNSDSSAILKLLPDLALSKQILVSSILSPKDMTSTELTFTVPKNLFSPELSSSLLRILKNYFDEEYKIKEDLSLMLEEALFDKGSYPVAVLPENAIDEFINGSRTISTEAFRDYVDDSGRMRNIGVLGPGIPNTKTKRAGISLESSYSPSRVSKIDQRVSYSLKDLPGLNCPNGSQYAFEDNLCVTDNFTILKLPKINHLINTNNVLKQYSEHSSFSLGLENEAQEFSDYQVSNLIFKNRSHEHEPISAMKPSSAMQRSTVGKPLIMKLPSESVIPVHVPGDMREQVGFFVVLDQDGNPVEAPDGAHDYTNSNQFGGGTLGSSLIRRVERNIGADSGSFNLSTQTHVNTAAKLYADVVEKDLINRVKNGAYTSDVVLAKNEEVYRIMLSRVLAKKYTQILYLPAEYVTYIAFKYNDYGIGKSLLDDTMTINTLRTVLMFTDIMASVKNSIGRTKVNVKLDNDDPNPIKTLEKIMDDVVASRSIALPLGFTGPEDIVNYVARAGYDYQMEEHPRLPNIKLDFENVASDYRNVDSELQENLRKASISSLGLTPELIDNGFSADFATTAVANNILLSKRVLNMQSIFTPQISDHLRKVARNSQQLINKLKSTLIDNAKDIKLEIENRGTLPVESIPEEVREKLIVNRAIHLLLSGFSVELPKPTSITLEQQVNDLDTYIDGLDKALEAYVSTDLMTDSSVGQISHETELIKSILRSHFIKRWLGEKGIMPELADITSMGPDDKPMLDIPKTAKTHLDLIGKAGVNTMLALKNSIKKNNEKLEKAGIDEEGSEPEGGSGFGDSDDDDGLGDVTDDGLDGDDGLEEDLGGETEPAPPKEDPEGEPKPNEESNEGDEDPKGEENPKEDKEEDPPPEDDKDDLKEDV